MASLQLAGSWDVLGRNQFIACLVSLAPFTAILIADQGILATVVQTVFMEVAFTYLIIRRASETAGFEAGTDSMNYARDFTRMAVYSILGWAQGQADRLVVGMFAGPALLGTYSLAGSLTRTVGDGLALSTANVVRATLFEHESDGPSSRRRAEAALMLAILAGAVVTVVLWAANELILTPFLGHEWKQAVEVVPVMGLLIVPIVFNWSVTPFLLQAGRLSRAVPVKLTGVLLCIPIGLSAAHSITLAAWMAVGREFIVMVLMVASCGTQAPIRAAGLATMLTCALSGAILLWL